MSNNISEVTVTRCYVCKRVQGESNHWTPFGVNFDIADVATRKPISLALGDIPTASCGRSYYHHTGVVCGDVCLHKLIAQVTSKESVEAAADRERKANTNRFWEMMRLKP